MPSSTQANVEYFFRLLYDLFGSRETGGFEAFQAFVAHLWTLIVLVGYAISVIAFLIIIYCTVRLFELRHREEEYYSTLIAAPESGSKNPRWDHIRSLIDGNTPSEWREAIIEADIMLDELLTREGYTGEGVGEKLRMATQADFHTLKAAWEAHRVRNQIAHQGSSFDLSALLARRTIGHYESVFQEFGVV